MLHAKGFLIARDLVKAKQLLRDAAAKGETQAWKELAKAIPEEVCVLDYLKWLLSLMCKILRWDFSNRLENNNQKGRAMVGQGRHLRRCRSAVHYGDEGFWGSADDARLRVHFSLSGNAEIRGQQALARSTALFRRVIPRHREPDDPNSSRGQGCHLEHDTAGLREGEQVV